MDYRDIERRSEAQRAAAYPEPDSYEGDEVAYITSDDVLDLCQSSLACGELLRDSITDDQALMIFHALRKGDLADIGFVIRHSLNQRAQELADSTNRCREQGLAEFLATKAEWLEDTQ